MVTIFIIVLSFAATMRVYHDFYHYKSGVYRRSGPRHEHSGTHSVRIIGWGEEPGSRHRGPLKFWVWSSIFLQTCEYLWCTVFQLVANSWGTEWGESGLFRILRGSNECGIESYVLGVWSKTVMSSVH